MQKNFLKPDFKENVNPETVLGASIQPRESCSRENIIFSSPSFPSCTWERKYSPSLAWPLMPPQTRLWNDKKSQLHFLFWNFLSFYITMKDMEQLLVLSKNQRRRLFLFRNGPDLPEKYPGNKEACRSNAPDPRRPQSGTISAIFRGRETPKTSKCLMLANIIW